MPVCSAISCLATRNGLEPSTSSVTGWRANRLHHRAKFGGNDRARTCDPLLVRQVLSQLSYASFLPPLLCFVRRRLLLYTWPHRLSSIIFGFSQFFSQAAASPFPTQYAADRRSVSLRAVPRTSAARLPLSRRLCRFVCADPLRRVGKQRRTSVFKPKPRRNRFAFRRRKRS